MTLSADRQCVGRFSGAGGVKRYGFQGQEVREEIWQGAVSFKYRVEDSRLGRFFSVDPLTKKYPFYSTYAFSGNRVIDMVELEGLEPAEPGRDGDIADAPAAGFEDKGIFSWSYTEGNWNLNASGNAEVSAPAPDFKSIVLSGNDKSTGEKVMIGSIRNDFVSAKINLGDLDSFDSKNRQIADFREFDRSSDGTQDAEMLSIGFGFALGGGVGYSITARSMNQGIFLYHNLDINVGVMASAGITMSTVDFNYDSGKELNSESFVGKSQGWSCSVVAIGVGELKSYTDGKWNRSSEIRTVLYTAKQIGLSTGTSVNLSPRVSLGAQYSFSITSSLFARFEKY